MQLCAKTAAPSASCPRAALELTKLTATKTARDKSNQFTTGPYQKKTGGWPVRRPAVLIRYPADPPRAKNWRARPRAAIAAQSNNPTGPRQAKRMADPSATTYLIFCRNINDLQDFLARMPTTVPTSRRDRFSPYFLNSTMIASYGLPPVFSSTAVPGGSHCNSACL